jgi:hypothetical protein
LTEAQLLLRLSFFLAREFATRNLLCVSIRDSGKLKTLVLLQQSGGDSPVATIL